MSCGRCIGIEEVSRRLAARSNVAISTTAAHVMLLGAARMVPANVLTISVLSIHLWVKRLCHRNQVERDACTDLKAVIVMTEQLNALMLLAAIWVDGWSNVRMEEWMESNPQRSVL